MRIPRRQKLQADTEDDREDDLNESPQDFLDRTHPANDKYMLGIEHVQRQIMAISSQLRPKQILILKSAFAGHPYTTVGKMHNTAPATVSRLVNSPNGQRLLNLLQYHLRLIDGPNEAQRRAMLWRIAQANEFIDPKTAIKANEALSKMHFQEHQLTKTITPPTQTQPTISTLLPRGKLD